MAGGRNLDQQLPRLRRWEAAKGRAYPRAGSALMNTGASSPGELEMTRSTSEVAVCCSRASASSRVRALACACRSGRVELAGRVVVGALRRFGRVGLRCCGFAGLRLIVRRRLTEPSHGPTTLYYHIVDAVVQHSINRPGYVRIGSQARITALQHPQPLHPNQQT